MRKFGGSVSGGGALIHKLVSVRFMVEITANYLEGLRPLPDIVVVLASVLGVKVWERARVLFVVPDLSENASVNVTHKDLTDSVKAMCCFSQYRVML